MKRVSSHLSTTLVGWLRSGALKRGFTEETSGKNASGIPARPGLLLLQIDGLSYAQFQRAMTRKRLPFITHLLQQTGITARSFYSGVPSTTPAVQGELFYGVKAAVPAFEFIDRNTRIRHAMFFPASANAIARQLRRSGSPLLAGGSSYANIYSGGAATARYCAESMNLESLFRTINPFKLIFMALFQIGKLLRIAGVAALELMLAVYDFFRGLFSGRNFFKELMFIPTRLFICVILRELVRFRVKQDLAWGVPIVAANFLGYDKQAHRRGPRSAFAHWTLKGIDETVKDLYQTARQSDHRAYQVVIYSDHGQETVRHYRAFTGKSLRQAIGDAFGQHLSQGQAQDSGETDHLLRHLYGRTGNFLFLGPMLTRWQRQVSTDRFVDDIQITTMGPLGHIYLPGANQTESGAAFSDRSLEQWAHILNRDARIPLVLFVKNKTVMAVNKTGTHRLWEARGTILGNKHPALDQAARDLARVAIHPHAGDFVICGWRPGEQAPLSFNVESGAHGGPGAEETRGFVILPAGMQPDRDWLRPLDLRNQILAYMGEPNAGPGQ